MKISLIKYINTFFLDSRNGNTVGRAHSTLSVSAVDYYLNLPVTCPPSPAVSTITLTPGRLRNIDQDMENLRASRQDNPFIQVGTFKKLHYLILLFVFMNENDFKDFKKSVILSHSS